MKILMLAWRDMKHPKKGGAEIVTDIYLKGLQKKGHEVTWISPMVGGLKKEETFNGYKIKRIGKGLWAHFQALIYAKKHEKEYDLIIDQVNTVPFFTPLLIKKNKRVAFFHQLCKNVWFYESKLPVSLMGYILESVYLKFYKNTRAFVVSESTRNDLVKHAWAKPENILVLDNQIDFKPSKKVGKKENYFVFVGRLTESKRVHDCVRAISKVKDSRLYVVGGGDEKYKSKLKEMVADLGLGKRVVFVGKVSNEKRNEIMAKAKAILVTSVREGWGLIVTEANAMGTMAITYDIEGVRDANKTGIICKKNNPNELAKAMKIVLEDERLLKKKSEESLKFAGLHADWNKNVRRLEKWLRKNI